MVKLYNTLSKKKEDFKPLKKEVGLYTCGPTVYDYAHIGNLRAYIFEDILKRTLYYNNYKVKHVMNITDVGHLTSDEDTGEDKIEKSAKEKKKTAWDIANYYTDAFKKDLEDLNIIPPDVYVKATETIEEQINLIKTLEKKGFTYQIKDGIYFDTSKLRDYGELANLKKVDLRPGARVEIKEKKNPTDFALWKFSKPEEKRQMEWNSPWGRGFPGWHTECVAMSHKYLGIPFDIHCGGVDHICVHHTNEIAQSKAAFGENLSRIWMHGEFLNLKDEKMSKSKGGFVTLNSLKKENISPLSYRYLILGTHYRSPVNFSKDSAESAESGLKNLQKRISELESGTGDVSPYYRERFLNAINDDLNTPKALETIWVLIKDDSLSDKIKRATVESFDRVLGLKLKDDRPEKIIPKEIDVLAKEREKARQKKDFAKADDIREKIKKRGYLIEDVESGYKIKKNDQ